MFFVPFRNRRTAAARDGSFDPGAGAVLRGRGRGRAHRRRAAEGSTLGWCAVAAMLLFAAAHLAWRGPLSVRGHWNLCDFASPWASARLWLTGQNPYDNARLWDTWAASRGAFDTDHEQWLALNAPGAYAAIAPLAALPAGVAGAAWLGVCAASVIAILGCALSLARVPARSMTAWLVISAALVAAPVQTALAVGQLSLPVIALCLGAMWLARGGRETAAGLALGVAAAVKPQLVAPLMAYFVLRGRWRLVLPAALLAVGLTLLAIVPMELRGIPWRADWSRNLALATAPGGANDPSATGPWRNQMIDLRAWLFALLDRSDVVTTCGLVLSMLLVAAYVTLITRARGAERDRPDDELLPLAALMALTLLPVYHKLYDATVLVLALAWALRSLREPRLRGVAVVTLAALSVFLIPFDLLPLLMQRTRALDGMSATWVWRAVIYPHHAIAALATALCLLYALRRGQTVRAAAPAPSARDADLEAELEELASVPG